MSESVSDRQESGSAEAVAEDGRSIWTSRSAFWLAAIGSAVGLGNLWRFPWQCAKWGGGPFLISYLLCLFFVGMPILTQELALGQKNRSGDIEAFGKMSWRLRGIGLASVIGAFGIMTYYSVVIGMSLVFLFTSMQSNLPYDSDHPGYWATDVLEICSYPPTQKCAEEQFSWKVYLATIATYLITFLCVYKGVKSASKVVKFTMPLPLLFLFILLIRNLFLKGADDGIEEYLDFTKWDELEDVGVWDAAIGQCFFSLSICMGVMTAYGSYNPISQNIAFDEKVISFCDLFVSLFAGFVVYTVLGHLNHLEEKDYKNYLNNLPSNVDMSYSTTYEPYMSTTSSAPYAFTNWYEQASFGLVFSAYPVAITEFGDAEQLFGVLFFLVLFLLGIDSLFSMVEAVSTVIVDSDVGRQFNLTHMKVTLFICICGCCLSSIYCLGSGLYWLDIIDRYINNYGMVFLGFMETSSVGWFYGLDRQISRVGQKAVLVYGIGFYLSLFIGVAIGFGVPTNYDYIGIIIGFICLFITLCISLYIIPSDMSDLLSLKEKLWFVAGWEGTEELRDFMNTNGVGPEWNTIRQTYEGEIKALLGHSTVSIFWGFLIKYFIPTVLSVVLIATIQDDVIENYEGYENKHLVPGIIVFSLMVFVVVVIGVFPQLLKQTSDYIGKTEGGEAVYASGNSKNMNSAGTQLGVTKHPVKDVSSNNVTIGENEITNNV